MTVTLSVTVTDSVGSDVMTGVRTNFTYCHRGSRGQAKLGGILASMLLMAMMTTHVLAISSALLSSDSRARGELLSSINRLRGSIEVRSKHGKGIMTK